MAYFHIYMDHVSNLIGLQIDFQFIINRYIANPKIKRKYIQQYFPAHSAHCHIKSIHDSPSQVSRSCHDINITNILTHFQIFLRGAARCCCPGLRNQTVLVLGADSGAGRCPPGPPLDVGEGGDLTADFCDTERISAT